MTQSTSPTPTATDDSRRQVYQPPILEPQPQYRVVTGGSGFPIQGMELVLLDPEE
jgi:hypothetical protein